MASVMLLADRVNTTRPFPLHVVQGAASAVPSILAEATPQASVLNVATPQAASPNIALLPLLAQVFAAILQPQALRNTQQASVSTSTTQGDVQPAAGEVTPQASFQVLPTVNPNAIRTGDVHGVSAPGNLQAGRALLQRLFNDPAAIQFAQSEANKAATRNVDRRASSILHMVGNAWQLDANILNVGDSRGESGDNAMRLAIARESARNVAARGLPIRNPDGSLSDFVKREAERVGDLAFLTLYHEESGTDLTGLINRKNYNTLDVNRTPLNQQTNFNGVGGFAEIQNRSGWSPFTATLWRNYWHNVANIDGSNDPMAAWKLSLINESAGSTNDAAALNTISDGRSISSFLLRQDAKLGPNAMGLSDNAYIPQIIWHHFDKRVPQPTFASIEAQTNQIGQRLGMAPQQMARNEQIGVNGLVNQLRAVQQRLLQNPRVQAVIQGVKDHPNLATVTGAGMAGMAAGVMAGCPYMGVLTAGMALPGIRNGIQQLP
jgi:hypothetical protein